MVDIELRSVDEVFALFADRGGRNYGERITMTEHALQSAACARAAGAPDALIAAALLHDVGHLVADVQGTTRAELSRDDDDHEAIGGRLLARLFGPAVAQPVALHVTAKRWRCTVDPNYHDQLSPTSQATLIAQGGLLDADSCRRFEAHPGSADALALRDFDDGGKVIGWEVDDLESYRPLLERLALR